MQPLFIPLQKIYLLLTSEFTNTIFPWVGKTGKLLRAYMNLRLVKSGFELSSKQWILLNVLHDLDGRPQNELADITDRDKASLGRLISNMEKRQLVVRIQDPSDKRINRVFLTKKGRKVFAETLPTIENAFETLGRGITPLETQQVIDVMKKVLQNIEQEKLITE